MSVDYIGQIIINYIYGAFHNRYARQIFFGLKHNNFEVQLMWCIFMLTLLTLFYLLIFYLDNYRETLRFLQNTQYAIT